jgi:hypothetical protein
MLDQAYLCLSTALTVFYEHLLIKALQKQVPKGIVKSMPNKAASSRRTPNLDLIPL